ncbi:hypothetical protein L596_025706 [Steinernema carpocapsae]|uniref:Uncharacterized protein n=1 Tax=Steinernema carpocapsae TaxID=34508 RepID=A0A4U5M8I9_STECR|nr:hypothetical protein L596_025706 [Steinernema carpocapsae]
MDGSGGGAGHRGVSRGSSRTWVPPSTDIVDVGQDLRVLAWARLGEELRTVPFRPGALLEKSDLELGVEHKYAELINVRRPRRT